MQQATTARGRELNPLDAPGALPAGPRQRQGAWALDPLYPQELDGPTEPCTTEGRSDKKSHVRCLITLEVPAQAGRMVHFLFHWQYD